MKSTSDKRLKKVDTIKINWETFKKTLKRNYLEKPDRWGRSYVLRLYPPFESKMKFEYYESEQGRHYNDEWNEKPIHIKPELILLEGCNRNPFRYCAWPTEHTVRNNLSDEEINELGGIDVALEEEREFFWNELKSVLPERIDLGRCISFNGKTVDLIWEF